ncbi:uncharacterized protein LOC111691795 [Anoplophora glabripennis]|uniref:uncharacterized protein LOC111691795 n=1 Tax=Anoplophora glabripennis TaxID=217634 RepID=UPI000A12E565|nr:uncharacterized protein LOC111691795 [Anoplophora glabripennis]
MEPTYKKNKGNAGLKGVQLQLDLMTVCLLNALNHHKNWKISSENQNAGKYDDIVVELPGGIAVLVQAKHKENRKITKEQLLSDNSKNADFSLPKYFFSYEEIKSKFRAKTVIICTNTDINTKGLENYLTFQRANPENVLYYEHECCSFYKFNENILPDLKRNAEVYFSKNLRDKSIDKAVITDENLKDFLKKLQIFSSYPCEDRLHKIIERLLSRSNPSSLCCKISAQEILRKVEHWFKHPKGEYLTERQVKAMLCEIKSDKYCESLKNYNLSFEQTDFSFTDSNRIFYITVEEGYLLQLLKIHHALRADKCGKLFVNPNEGLEAQKQVIEAFELQRYALLVMTWTEITEEAATNEISAKLRGILDKYKYKKVVLVEAGNSKLAQRIGLDISKVDGSVTFDNFSKDCQERLMNSKNVIFQGNTVSLKELLHTDTSIDYTKSLNSLMLEKLIGGEKVTVGVQSLGLDKDIARSYVSRRFEKHIDKGQKREEPLSEESIFNVKGKAIIISDSAGMGKSTVLTKMSATIKERNSHLWVIKINLNDYTSILRNTLKTQTKVISVVELLNSREATKLTNQLEEIVFFMNEKVVLMLDGVDEISPDYTDLILNLLGQCQQDPNFVKIFVTTRPHVALKLRAVLGVGTFKLLPFTRSDQVNFLTNYWIHNLNLNYGSKTKCERYAKILIDNLSSWTRSNYSSENSFEEIPLQVRMVAEIFQESVKWKESADWEGCKEYLSGDKAEPKLPKKFNIAILYDVFIEKKRDVFMDKGNTSGNTVANQAFSNHFKGCLAYHHSLALKVILGETKSRLFSCYDSRDEDMEEYVLKIGIVHRLGDEFQFVHRSFAEYFATDSIVQELNNQNPNVEFQRFLIDVLLLNDRFEVVRAFLDILLQKVSLPPNIFRNYRSVTSETNLGLIFNLAGEGYTTILRLILKSINFKIIRGKAVDVKECRAKMTFKKRNTLNDLKVLVRKAGVNIKDDSGSSPLHFAVRGGHWEMANFLVEQGASLNLTSNDDETALYLAAEYRRWNIVNYLAEQGADVNANKNNSTALHFAAEFGRMDTVLCLVQHGAYVNVKDSNGNTALHLAAEYRRWDIGKCLVKHGADVNVKDSYNRTALHFAVKQNSLHVVRYLVKYGANVNIQDSDDSTALHLAVGRITLDVAKYLVEHGADVNVKRCDGSTALHLVTKYVKIDAVEYLVEHGANVNAKDDNGNAALHFAVIYDRMCSVDLDSGVRYGNWKVVKYLVEHGADVNVKDNNGNTLLHLAVVQDRFDTVKYLVQCGVSVNVANNDDRTALHLAAEYRRLFILEYLVEHGADDGGYNEENSEAGEYVSKKYD